MPPKLDYSQIDQIIQENPELSAYELCNNFNLDCSLQTLCRRKKHLGAPPAKRGAKLRDYNIIDHDNLEKPTQCICPMCGVHHTMNLWFTGRGIPRKYCTNCSIHGVNDAWTPHASDNYGGSAEMQLNHIGV